MKIYVAGKFEEIELIRSIYRQLEGLGHEISYDWTTHEKVKPYEENVERAKGYAENEIKAILDSDAFIYLTHERGTTLHMEFGAALAKAERGENIMIFAVGEHNNRSPWYFNQHVTRVAQIQEVMAQIA